MTTQLPIDVVLSDVIAAVKSAQQVVVRASPGSGKTTRIPPALLAATDKKILVLEPRRLAAKLAAGFIAKEMQQKLGETIGYQVRFENETSNQTRIVFITEGLLIRKFLSDPVLSDVGIVILDEFHERHIHTDIALALLDRLQQTKRVDLKVIVMSATLDVSDLQAYYPKAAFIDVPAVRHPIDVRYHPAAPPATSYGKIDTDALLSAIKNVLSDVSIVGDILVFLPGARDIDDARVHLQRNIPDNTVAILPLHASLPSDQQALVFAKSSRRKIILSTNVAESSVTIPGVRVVIDTGLAKIPSQAAWSGLSTLQLRPISRSSCVQRTGRAGREGPGWCVRLFSEAEFLRRREFEAPEIQRLDLTQMLLELKAISPEHHDDQLRWLSPIDSESRKRSILILQLLGALNGQEQLTELGEKMARLPLHPRLSRLCLAGRDQNCVAAAVATAALLQEGVPNFLREQAASIDNDLGFALRKILRSQRDGRFDQQVPAAIARSIQQIAHLLNLSTKQFTDDYSEDDLAQALLAAFPDRVAKKRGALTTRLEFNLCLGGGAVLSDQCRVRDHEWIIALDAMEDTAKAAASAARIITACAVDLINLDRSKSPLLTDATELIWDEAKLAIRSFKRRKYGQLVIEERQNSQVPVAESESLLAAKLKEYWPKPFADASDLVTYQARAAVVRQYQNSDDFLDLAGAEFDLLIAMICEGKKSFSEITSKSLGEYINELLSYEAQQLLANLAPLKLKLTNGRLVDVHYELNKTPWVESRLQDFFGNKTTPTIANGRLALLVHLLAPNRRPVQVTQDLISFWQNSYPKLRNELSRNYPRHAWPEDPINAEPPPLGKLR